MKMKAFTEYRSSVTIPVSHAAAQAGRCRRSAGGAHWLAIACLLAGPLFAADLEYDEYVQRAAAAEKRGDWQSAANQFALAVNHADLPRDGAARSAMHLGYGRALGVLCQYGEAEKYLQRAREIAEKAGSPTFAPLYELGAISVAQQKHAAAIDYFSQLAPLLEREPRGLAPAATVADVHEKLAAALAATGRTDEAASRRRQADRMRAAGSTSPLPAATTPYGTQCPKS
jgi:tetratricopeptide (TPR) repeat protein